MKRFLLWAGMACACVGVSAATVEFSSPDKKLRVTVADDGGRPVYNVAYDGVVFLENSPLGMRTDLGDWTQGMTLADTEFRIGAKEIKYDLRTIKRSHVDVQATRAVCPFYKDGKRVMDVEFHVSGHDVAFRYKLYPQGDRLCLARRQHHVPLPAVEAHGRVCPHFAQL